MVLLDTGIHASEFCALKVEDVDRGTGKVEIKHGTEGGAKGSKGRTVYLGKASRRALWHYLAGREDGQDLEAPLFITSNDRLMRPCTLRHLLAGLGQKVGVPKTSPHKFRHTFAITYLRSGGDVFTLQQILGHASLDTVRLLRSDRPIRRRPGPPEGKSGGQLEALKRNDDCGAMEVVETPGAMPSLPLPDR